MLLHNLKYDSINILRLLFTILPIKYRRENDVECHYLSSVYQIKEKKDKKNKIIILEKIALRLVLVLNW